MHDKPLVLLAEDDELQRELLALQISELGYRVITAEDGAQAERLLFEHRPQILVTDNLMPHLSGVELARRARTRKDLDVYIILVTARSGDDDVRAGMDAGADDFISKPINPLKLQLRLASATRTLRLQRRLLRRNDRLSDAHGVVRDAYRLMRRDLEAAAVVQQSLAPPPGTYCGIQFDWLLWPSQHLGGDLFDVIKLPGERILATHIDVAGHGVPAALRAVMAHDRLARAAVHGDLVATAADLNARLCRDGADDGYCTAALVLVDAAKRQAEVLRAGHPAPILMQASGRRMRLKDGGLPLGLFEDSPQAVQTVRFEEGDRLLLFSDGVTDCEDEAGRPFGEPALEALLVKTGYLSAKEAVLAIGEALRAHSAGVFEDDVSLLLIEHAYD